MKLVLAALMLASFQASARTIHCFSKYFGANQFTISLDATIVNDDTIKDLKIVDDGDGFKVDGVKVKLVDGNHKPNGPYADYQDMHISNQDKEGKKYLMSLDFLLPKKLTTIKDNAKFDGYGSDPNADDSGSDGYQRLLCHVEK